MYNKLNVSIMKLKKNNLKLNLSKICVELKFDVSTHYSNIKIRTQRIAQKELIKNLEPKTLKIVEKFLVKADKCNNS